MRSRTPSLILSLVLVVALAACGDDADDAEPTVGDEVEDVDDAADDDDADDDDAGDEEDDGELTEEEIIAQQEELAATADLTFWSWVPNIEQIVDIWNEQNPDVQVAVNSQAGGDELITRMLIAHQAGTPPDLVQAEYQALPTLVTNGVVADLSGMVTDEADLFPEGAWDLVTLGTDNVFAVPQDIGPMMYFYRHDVFDEIGLEVPTTWDEFADVAAQVREQDDSRYLANFSPGDAGWFAGLSQQAGAQWWSTNDDAWVVGIDEEPTQRVASFWGDLVGDDLVSSGSNWTPEWNSALADGSILSWVGSVWSPQVIAGIAENTQGQWAMAPLPTWEGAPVTGFWGGSSTAIAADSPAMEDAFRFAVWLNTQQEAVDELVAQGGIYPASLEGQAALDEPPSFMPNQPDFYAEAASIAETAQGFTFGPNVNTTYNLYNDSFDQAIRDGSSFLDAVASMDQGTVSDLQGRGFTVED